MSGISNAPKGKVGRLPFEIRQAINYMMRDNAKVSEMNAFLVSKSVKDAPFNGTNFTNWRKGGYKVWLQEQARYDEKREKSEQIKRELEAGGFDTLNAAALEITERLMDADIKPEKAAMAVSALKTAVNGSERVKIADQRTKLAEQALTFERDKFRQRLAENVLRFAKDSKVQEIVARSGSSQEDNIKAILAYMDQVEAAAIKS